MQFESTSSLNYLYLLDIFNAQKKLYKFPYPALVVVLPQYHPILSLNLIFVATA